MNERQLKKLPLHRKVAVGHRLYFKRTDRAAGQWTFRYTRLNQTREMGLGPYPRISLKKAFESTVIRWVKAKHFIPPFVLGPNKTVWSKTAVMAWLEKQKDNIVDWVE